jgi:hypothetical protein
MSTRTVRLDDESEKILEQIQRQTGLSVSDVLKTGLLAAHNELRRAASAAPYEIYERIDLGPGGTSRAPARRAKQAIREVLRQKRAR